MKTKKTYLLLVGLVFFGCLLDQQVIISETGVCYSSYNEYQDLLGKKLPIVTPFSFPDTVFINSDTNSFEISYSYIIDTAFFDIGTYMVAVSGWLSSIPDSNGSTVSLDMYLDKGHANSITKTFDTLSSSLNIIDNIDYESYYSQFSEDTALCRLKFYHYRYVDNTYCHSKTIDSLSFIVIRERINE